MSNLKNALASWMIAEHKRFNNLKRLPKAQSETIRQRAERLLARYGFAIGYPSSQQRRRALPKLELP